MRRPLSPPEVFLALVHGVCEERWAEVAELYAQRTHVVHPFDPHRKAPRRTPGEIHAHFRRSAGAGPRLRRHPAGIRIHQTVDPEVIVAEFEYRGTVVDTGEEFSLPAVFVMRVRDGKIVSSRDYADHVTAARITGQLDALLAAAAGTGGVPGLPAGGGAQVTAGHPVR